MATIRTSRSVADAVVSRLNAAPITTTHEVDVVTRTAFTSVADSLDGVRSFDRAILVHCGWNKVFQTLSNSPIHEREFEILVMFAVRKRANVTDPSAAAYDVADVIVEAAIQRLLGYELFTTEYDCSPLEIESSSGFEYDEGAGAFVATLRMTTRSQLVVQ